MRKVVWVLFFFFSHIIVYVASNLVSGEETINDLKATIDNLNKEIQYLESQLPKAATAYEQRKLRYDIEDKKEKLEYNQMI